METSKQYPDFVHIGMKILLWFEKNGRKLPFREEKSPYFIWISEVIFQQTRIQQGMEHYLRFVERFPTVQHLASATEDEVMLYWKGLGYYSRAINLHHAAQQIMNDYSGEIPSDYRALLRLKGVGKYIASAVMSIAFNQPYPAVDGNLYRVLSRFFCDDYDISQSKAFDYFSELAMRMMPVERAGDFNEAMMDIGAEICTPKNPRCTLCPIHTDCMAYSVGKVLEFPIKKKKIVKKKETIDYFFLHDGQSFWAKQRGKETFWKSLYEFPSSIPEKYSEMIYDTYQVRHQFTHKDLTINIHLLERKSEETLEEMSIMEHFEKIDFDKMDNFSFPKPLQDFLRNKFSL